MSEPNGTVRDEVGRCPSCGARVVPDQDWCTLCLQPLRAPAAAAPVDDVASLGADVEGAPVDPADPYGSSVAPDAGPPGRGSSGDLPPLVAEAMLAELAASTAADRPLARGPLAGTSRSVRLAVGCGAGVVLLGVLLLLLTLLGLLL